MNTPLLVNNFPINLNKIILNYLDYRIDIYKFYKTSVYREIRKNTKYHQRKCRIRNGLCKINHKSIFICDRCLERLQIEKLSIKNQFINLFKICSICSNYSFITLSLNFVCELLFNKNPIDIPPDYKCLEIKMSSYNKQWEQLCSCGAYNSAHFNNHYYDCYKKKDCKCEGDNQRNIFRKHSYGWIAVKDPSQLYMKHKESCNFWCVCGFLKIVPLKQHRTFTFGEYCPKNKFCECKLPETIKWTKHKQTCPQTKCKFCHISKFSISKMTDHSETCPYFPPKSLCFCGVSNLKHVSLHKISCSKFIN